jgi:hypothetical protein
MAWLVGVYYWFIAGNAATGFITINSLSCATSSFPTAV